VSDVEVAMVIAMATMRAMATRASNGDEGNGDSENVGNGNGHEGGR
jgi:hypothetical protein